jgi:hypothetical protein
MSVGSCKGLAAAKFAASNASGELKLFVHALIFVPDHRDKPCSS